MRTQGKLTCTRSRQAPSRTALDTFAQIQQMLMHGCTPEQIAQARADLDAMNVPQPPRQSRLPLFVKP